MIKKTVGSFIAASAIFAILSSGVSAAGTTQNQTDDVTVTQTQNVSGGWTFLQQKQKSDGTRIGSQIGSNDSAGQGHSVFVTGSQHQFVNAEGPSTVTQSDSRDIAVADEQSVGPSEQEQTTELSGSSNQSTSTEDSAYILQAQRNTNAVGHFQAEIKNGPSIQHQFSQNHSYQFSTAISK